MYAAGVPRPISNHLSRVRACAHYSNICIFPFTSFTFQVIDEEKEGRVKDISHPILHPQTQENQAIIKAVKE